MVTFYFSADKIPAQSKAKKLILILKISPIKKLITKRNKNTMQRKNNFNEICSFLINLNSSLLGKTLT